MLVLYSDTENILIIKQENDFTSLNITFIQLKISPQKYVCKGFKWLNKYSRILIANHGLFFFFFFKIENNWNYISSSNCHMKQSFALVPQIFTCLLFFKWIKFYLHCHDAEMLHKALREANPMFPEAKVLLRHCPLLVWRVSNPKWALVDW